MASSKVNLMTLAADKKNFIIFSYKLIFTTEMELFSVIILRHQSIIHRTDGKKSHQYDEN